MIQPGLTEPHDNRIEVCGRPCEVIFDDATFTTDFESTFCVLPSLPTTFSVDNYEIEVIEDVFLNADSVTSSAPQAEIDKLTDGNVLEDFVDSSSSCFVEFAYQVGYYAILEDVSIYIDNPTDIVPYANSLAFQGWDGSTWIDLWVLDENVKDGCCLGNLLSN